MKLEYIDRENSMNIQSDNSKNKIQTPHFLVKKGYRYIQLIGEGANGKTYKARNLKTGEIVAVKVLKFSENLKNYDLFHREAKVLKSLNIKGIPRYYDFLAQNNEFTECWLVQEYIEGNSLLDQIEIGKKFDEIETLSIMRDVAHIVYDLQTAYAPPIIHRDIKPSNIMLDGEITDNHKLHLIDFGAVANPQKRTGGSTVAGTVGYMAPEQLMGDCTIQSDYYAIGATALHLMTGIAPSDLPSEGFNLHFEDELKKHIPDIHPKTLDLLHKLLATKPQDRPKDASELIRLIDEALLDLYTIAKNSQNKLSIISYIHNFLRLPLYAIFSVLIFACIVFMIDELSHFKPIVFYGSFIIIVSFMMIMLITRWGKRLEKLEDNKLRILHKYQQHLPGKLEEGMKVSLSDIKSKDRVQGTVVAHNSRGTEFVFVVNGKTYACYQPEHIKRKIGDKIPIIYGVKKGKVHGIMDSTLSN